MSATAGERRVGRILVELPADADAGLAAAHAGRLARIFDAEVRAVFVEDAALLDLAALALATEVGRVSRRTRALEADALLQEMQHSLARARRAFTALEASLPRPVHLGVRRVRPREPALEVGPEDLVLYAGSVERLGEPGFSLGLLEAGARSVGLALAGGALHPGTGPIAAIVRSEEGSERAQALLRRVAEIEQCPLEIILSDSPSLGLARLLAPFGHRPRTDRVPSWVVVEAGLFAGTGGRALRSLVRTAGSPLLLLNLGSD